jgi:hypothetical protein
MAENQSSHRQALERQKLEADIGHERLGMIFALAISIVGIIAGGVLVAIGKDVAGYGALLAGFAAPVARLFAEWRQSRELKERSELAQAQLRSPAKLDEGSEDGAPG